MIKVWTAEQQADFAQQLAACNRAVLFFDYDGTLAPIVPDRDAAVPYPGVRELFEKLLQIKRIRTVLVSGRRAHEIQPLLQSRVAFEAWGSHGGEHLRPSGQLCQEEIPEEAKKGLRIAAEQIKDLLGEHEIECKPNSVAAHFSKLASELVPQYMDEVEELWEPLVDEYGLELLEFHDGMEMRVPGINKSKVINTVLSEEPKDALTVYIGDDRTDEDAFKALEHSPNTILIAKKKRPSAAKWLLLEEPDGRHIINFLNSVLSTVS